MNYNIEDMRNEIVRFADISKEEADAMSAAEIVSEWLSLPTEIVWGC